MRTSVEMNQRKRQLLGGLSLVALTLCATSCGPRAPYADPSLSPADSTTATRPKTVPPRVQIDVLDDPKWPSVSYYAPWLESGDESDKYRYALTATQGRGTDHVSYWIMFGNTYTDVSQREWDRLTVDPGQILEITESDRETTMCAVPLGVCGYSERIRAVISSVHLAGELRVRAHAQRMTYVMYFPAAYVESLVHAVEAGPRGGEATSGEL